MAKGRQQKAEVAIDNSRTEFFDTYQEASLITSMIYFPEFIEDVMRIIPVDEVFQNEHLRVIYQTIVQMYRDGEDVSSISVSLKLRSNGSYMAVSKSGSSLQMDHVTPQDLEEVTAFAEGLLSMYRRQLAYSFSIKLYSELMKDVRDTEISDYVFKIYESLTVSGGKTAEKSSKDAAYGALKLIEEAMNRRNAGKVSGIPTGSYKLDRELGGWQNDEVILLAARPAQGKTAYFLHAILHAAENGFAVGVFSLEMDSENLNFRLAAAKTKIPYSDMIKGNISKEQFVLIQTALSEIAKLPIYYYDDSSIQDVEKIDQVATEWCRKRNIKLIGIDYIQYLRARIKGTTVEQISAVSRSIKSMQRRLKVPVLALAQLGRDVDKRANPRPLLDDLKESGQLEQDASTVIGLFYPTTYLRKGMKDLVDENSNLAFENRVYCCYLLKRRSGDGHARVDLYADLATNRFADTNTFDNPIVIKPTNQLDVFANEPWNDIDDQPF